MSYRYQAYTSDRKIVQGIIDAASEGIAEDALYRQGYQRVLSMEEAPPRKSLEELIPSLFGVKTQDVIEFSRQLATLIEAGIPLLTALRLMEEHASRAALSRIIAGLTEDLQGGRFFSEALSRHPAVFPYTYCQVIKASEQAGNLEVGLRQIADYLEKQAFARQRVMRALAYPAFVLVVAAGVAVLLVTIALPPLVNLFNSLGAELPWTTRMLISTADFFINYKFYILGGLAMLVLLVASYIRLPAGKMALDRLMLSAPVIGPLNVERHVAQFCQAVAMMLQAGLRLPQIMENQIQAFRNSLIQQALRSVREKLIQGQSLSQPLIDTDLFPRLLGEMVFIGEKAGTIDSTLRTVADLYERKVNQKIDMLTSMIEPVLTVIVGLVVVFMALSMIMPLYSILRSMY